MTPRTRTRRRPISEAELETYFRTAVKKLLRGHTVKLVPVEGGIPDRVVLLPGGQARFVELKTNGGRPSARQTVWVDRLGKLGFPAAILTGTAEVDAWVVAVQKELYT